MVQIWKNIKIDAFSRKLRVGWKGNRGAFDLLILILDSVEVDWLHFNNCSFLRRQDSGFVATKYELRYKDLLMGFWDK